MTNQDSTILSHLNELSEFLSNNKSLNNDICLFLTSLVGLGANRCVLLLYKKNHSDKPLLLDLLTNLSDYVLKQIKESHLSLKEYNQTEYNLILDFINKFKNNNFKKIEQANNNTPESDYGKLCMMVHNLIIKLNQQSDESNWLDSACELGRLAYYIVQYHYVKKPQLLKLYKNNLKLIFESVTSAMDKWAMDTLYISFGILYEYNLLNCRFIELYYMICGPFELSGKYPFDDYLDILSKNRIHICDVMRLRPELSDEMNKRISRDSTVFKASMLFRQQRKDSKYCLNTINTQMDFINDTCANDKEQKDLRRILKLQLISETLRGLDLQIGFIDNAFYNYMNKTINELTDLIYYMDYDDLDFKPYSIDTCAEKYKNFDSLIGYIDKWIRLHTQYLDKQPNCLQLKLHRKYTLKFMYNYLNFLVKLSQKLPSNIAKLGTTEPHKYIVYTNWVDHYCNLFTQCYSKSKSLKESSKDYSKESLKEVDHDKIFNELMTELEAEYQSFKKFEVKDICEFHYELTDECETEIVEIDTSITVRDALREKYQEAYLIMQSDIHSAEKMYQDIIEEAKADNPKLVVDCLAELVTCYMQLSKVENNIDYIYNSIIYAEDDVDYYQKYLSPMLENKKLTQGEINDIYNRSKLVYFQLHNSREWLQNILDFNKNKLEKVQLLKEKIEKGRLEAMSRMQDKWYSNPNRSNKYSLFQKKLNDDLVQSTINYQKIKFIESKYQMIYSKINLLYLEESSSEWQDKIIGMSKALIIIETQVS
jgi:adenosyl cobinamide kinase/adenosyl cobinamide phosphate guanylyltransferase